VYGRDIVTGLPVEREIPTKLVDEALSEHFNTIIDNVKVILERTPPELAADIYRHGIYLTGGASQVNHLAEKLAKGTGLKVNMSENPVTSVALGLAKIIKDDNYKSVASTIEGMSK
jgi:rod shape-determining protein MreB